jgi:hypothetical protein
LRYYPGYDVEGVRNRVVVSSDAGAPLAWDHSDHVLWSISGGTLVAHIRIGFTFHERKHLRLPKRVQLRTSSHSYRSAVRDQPGARFQDYWRFGTEFAVPSGLAVDLTRGVTFYTQANPPFGKQYQSIWTGHTAPPLAGFSEEPDPKWQRSYRYGWVVMAY